MAHIVAHNHGKSQGCFGSVWAGRPIQRSSQRGASAVFQGSSSRFSKLNDQLNEYQNEYQTDTNRFIPIEADTRSSQTKPQKNLNKTGQRRPIPTLASNPNRVCGNGLRTRASATDTKTDT
jgi:hypothetical protein